MNARGCGHFQGLIAVRPRVAYRIGTALGGIAGPVLFGALIQTGAWINIVWGYLLGAALLLLGAAVEARIGIAAEGRSLEDVPAPLSKI
jgi:hypothetical protein